MHFLPTRSLRSVAAMACVATSAVLVVAAAGPASAEDLCPIEYQGRVFLVPCIDNDHDGKPDPVETPPAPVTPPPTSKPTTLTATVPSTVTYGTAAVFSAKLTAAGKAVPGKSVRLCVTQATAKQVCYSRTTDATGIAALSLKPSRNTAFAASFAGADDAVASKSTGRTTLVRPAVAAKGSKAALSLAVRPTVKATVNVQVYKSGAWRTAKSKLSTTSTGTLTVKSLPSGKYRIQVPAQAGRTSNNSPTVTVLR